MTDLERAQLESTCGNVAAALGIPRAPDEPLEAWRDRLVASSDVRLWTHLGASGSIVAIHPGVVVTKVVVPKAMDYVCVDWDAIASGT